MNARVIKNSFFNVLAFITIAGVSFLITPFMVHKLGKTVYGVWSILISLTGYFGLLDFGIRTAVVKYVSEYHSGGNYEALRTMNGTLWALYTCIGLFSWIAMVTISFFIPQIFNIQEASSISIIMVMIIIGADLFLNFFFVIFQGNLAGHQRYDIIFTNSTVACLLRGFLIWYLLSRNSSLIVLSIAVAAANGLGYCMNYLSYRLICKQDNFTMARWKTQELRKILRYSVKSFITNISDKIVYYSDSIIIGIFLYPESVTFYAIASSLIAYIRQLVLAVCGTFIPAVSEAESKGNQAEIHRLVIDGTKLVLLVLVPISVALVILGSDFIYLWMGPGFEKSYQVLIILVISQFLVLSQYGVAMALYGTSRHGLIAKANVIVGALNIILSLILVRPFGLIGIAVASAISMAVLQLYLLPMLRLVGIPLTVFLRKAILPFIGIGCLYTGVLTVGKMQFDPNSWFRFSELLVVSVAIYLMLCYPLGLSKAQRRRIATLLAEWLDKLKVYWPGRLGE